MGQKILLTREEERETEKRSRNLFGHKINSGTMDGRWTCAVLWRRRNTNKAHESLSPSSSSSTTLQHIIHYMMIWVSSFLRGHLLNEATK